MKINANDLKVGNVIEYKSRLWVIAKTAHTQPGKGGAYIQAEMKGLLDSTKLNERFRSSETLEKVHLEEIEHQYLFADGDMLTFMHPESYEQISLPADILGDSVDFLQDGMMINLCFHEGNAISATLPDSVIMQLTEAEPTVKGQTASSSYKPATLENGRRVLVPQFIEAGERIVVDTRDGSYVERAKS